MHFFKRVLYSVFGLLNIFIFSQTVTAQDYIVIGWNDLGMHCCNQDFSTISILPPYNNIFAQVIQKGNASDPPHIITQNITVTYEIPGNTYSVGKTNFWDYEDKLFGVNLDPNMGLEGHGLSGNLDQQSDHFSAFGVPLTPYTDTDLQHEDAYQLGLIRVYDTGSNLLAETQPVIPVSNEINCVSSGCHSSEQDILNEHEREGGFDPNDKPVFCSDCHEDNALNKPGHAGVPAFSEVIHKKHADKTNDCYKCHPGPNTQCLRGTMKTDHNFICQDCHGSMREVGESVKNGRRPWLDEPSCGSSSCHGSKYAEEDGKLYKDSRGHGGLFCSACHGEQHAISPSGNDRDNVQAIALQGHSGTLNDCKTCHGVNPDGPGPHGLLASAVHNSSPVQPSKYALFQNYPNPFGEHSAHPKAIATTIKFAIQQSGRVTIEVFDVRGRQMATVLKKFMNPGEYNVRFTGRFLPTGIYFYRLSVNRFTQTRKMFVVR